MLGYKASWFNSIDLHYANAIFYYKKNEKSGELISAAAATFMYAFGFAALGINIVQLFIGSLAPYVRGLSPLFDRPYDNAAEYLIAFPAGFLLYYVFFWRRTSAVLDRYIWLEESPSRLMLGAGGALSMIFAVVVTFGRSHFLLSTFGALMVLLFHAMLWRHVAEK